MNLHGVGLNPAHPQVERGNQNAKTEAAETSGAVVPEGSGNERGVIRLLQEGHFRGVADVRLRINFADELSAIAQSSTAASAQEEISNVLLAVDVVVEEFLATPDLPEGLSAGILELQAAFEESAAELVEVFSGPEGGDATLLIADLQATFEEFLAGVIGLLSAQEVVAPPEEGSDTGAISEDVPEVAPAVEPAEEDGEDPQLPEDYQVFVDAIREAFVESLEDFTTALESAATVLPELSEPNGNGVAYAKFLAIFNEISGIAPEPESSASEFSVNLEA